MTLAMALTIRPLHLLSIQGQTKLDEALGQLHFGCKRNLFFLSDYFQIGLGCTFCTCSCIMGFGAGDRHAHVIRNRRVEILLPFGTVI